MAFIGKEVVDNVNRIFEEIRGKYDLISVNYDGSHVNIGVNKTVKKEDIERLRDYFLKSKDKNWEFWIEDVRKDNDVRSLYECNVPSQATKVLRIVYINHQSKRISPIGFITAYDNGILRFFYSMLSIEDAPEILKKVASDLYNLKES